MRDNRNADPCFWGPRFFPCKTSRRPPAPGEGSLTTILLPGEKVLRYEADEGSLLPPREHWVAAPSHCATSAYLSHHRSIA